ncbi:MAG TPA: class I SAM-dependent methyltransferase [Aggregatilineaceae bacterium]|nr:class I SAM-dependent methyltransferase [Aggregatilineaceae bacterium]
MPDDPLHFYQQLARDYHLIFTDWLAAIDRQGAALNRLIQARRGAPPLDLLDCSCGIGTQSLGLAKLGYRVHATDLSPAAVERAQQEANKLGVAITVGVADFRKLVRQVAGTYDVVLSCDNSLPHLLTDQDLLLAAQNMREKLRDDGLLLVSIRDYDHITLDRPRATEPQVIDDEAGRRIVFQVWDWSEDGTCYTINMFILREAESGWSTNHYRTTYRALQRSELSAILDEAGFSDIRWHVPQDTGYYQPIVTAKR